MACEISESLDSLSLSLTPPVLPEDMRVVQETIQNFCLRQFGSKSRCACKVGLHEVRASTDLYACPPDDRQKILVYYCETEGCGRMACTASQEGYADHCCKDCAEKGEHSLACDTNWVFMSRQIQKREIA